MQKQSKYVMLILLLISNLTYSQNSLIISDPRSPRTSSKANIRNSVIDIYPGFAYTKLDLTFEITNIGTNLENYTQNQEIIYNFELPRNEDFITNSFLWVEDTLVEAILIDLWTADQIYEEVVERRQDPSILKKNSLKKFSLNVYPLLDSSSRKVKISFNLLNTINGGEISTTFPMIFNFLGISPESVQVYFQETSDYRLYNLLN